MNSWSTQSFSFMAVACLPRPPRFCERYSDSGWLLMYPPCDRVTTMSIGVIRSSVSSSVALTSISARRVSLAEVENSALMACSSSLMIVVMRSGRARMSSRSAMVAITSLYSPMILSCSRPVRRCRRMLRISCAWVSLSR
ncbi:Uncharacterised protein [Bordetella pertussis]|nr:Uncharacterised protein [Bordetella pertussis]CFO67336.1 Uncharacterised protein [Bordetella pertussis]CFU81116.1 Uncharacterised protein [Bordetella pertussis]CFW33898.1 Uncharacterised protein [Bordetella pertussis]CPH82849.1 Uncharacterised protein [Bordetella pertussis]